MFLYVRGADTRADQRYEAVQVLRAVKQIEPGETVEAAQAAGKIETGSVSQKDLLPDALTGDRRDRRQGRRPPPSTRVSS